MKLKKNNEHTTENECEIWKAIRSDIKTNTNFDKWFGSYDINEHPDMGYFIGYRIVQSYFEKTDDKHQALLDIIEIKHPKEILKKK